MASIFSLLMTNPEQRYFAPTLSELIEACGVYFDFLANNGRNWRARSVMEKTAEGEGSNPEEAIARLWLALNKN